MSRSDWRRYDQIVIAFGIAAIGCLLLFATWQLSATNASYTHDADHAARESAENAESRIGRACTDREIVAFTKCVREEIQAEQASQTAQYDLAEQRRMALWAQWSFIVSAFSLLATGIGIYFVWKTLTANIAAVETANRAIASDREIGEAQVRAYVTIAARTLEIIAEVPRIELQLVNTGNSPAFDVRVYGNWGYSFYGQPVEMEPSTGQFTSISTLRSGQESNVIQVPLSGKIDSNQKPTFGRERLNTLLISIVIRVTYTDVFKKLIAFENSYGAIIKGWPDDPTATLHEVALWSLPKEIQQ